MRIHERQRFLQSIAAGLADANAGRLMTTEEVKKRLAARRLARAKRHR